MWPKSRYFKSELVWNWIVSLVVLSSFAMTLANNDTEVVSISADQALQFSGSEYKANVLQHRKVVVCYVGTWAAYRQSEGKFDVDDIDPKLCTHLIYSFAGLDNSTFEMKPLDPWLDLYSQQDGGGRDWYAKFNKLKRGNPHLKVLLAIGGWNEGAEKYSTMSANPTYRNKFVQSALNLIKQHGFDGLDLDWEFPGDQKRGGRPIDKQAFTLLVQDLRRAFNQHGLILTAALGPAKSTAENGYEADKLARLLDQIHLMCYDYHGSWDGITSHNAPLYAPEGEGSVQASVGYYLSKGVPPHKLVMGLPTYGRAFLLQTSAPEDEPELGKPAPGSGFKGPFTNEAGFLGYNEIVRELLSNRGEWKTFWDDVAKVPFMRSGTKWLSFDNPKSIEEKVNFILKKKLRGAMFWSIETDDFRGHSRIKYPLLKTVNYAFSQAPQSNEIPVDNYRPKGNKSGASSSYYPAASGLSLILFTIVALFII